MAVNKSDCLNLSVELLSRMNLLLKLLLCSAVEWVSVIVHDRVCFRLVAFLWTCPALILDRSRL